MGLFAPVAAYLAAKIGTRRAMTIGLALIGVFGILRATMPSAWLVVLLTWPVGVGMGLGNALAPISVKEHFEDRPAVGTGVYTTGIQIGSTSAAALAVPLAGVARRLARRPDRDLVRRAALARRLGRADLGRGAARCACRRRCRGCRGEAGPPGCSSRSSRSWPRPTTASTPGSRTRTPSAGGATERPACCSPMMNLTAIPASFLIPWLSDRTGRRSPFLLGLSVCFITGAVVLVAVPGLAYAGALLAGIAQGGLFALVMTLPLDFERTPARVGALVAMMLGLGYTIGATAPFLLGAVRDATGSFDAVLWLAAGFLMAQFFALLALTRRHPSEARLAS